MKLMAHGALVPRNGCFCSSLAAACLSAGGPPLAAGQSLRFAFSDLGVGFAWCVSQGADKNMPSLYPCSLQDPRRWSFLHVATCQ